MRFGGFRARSKSNGVVAPEYFADGDLKAKTQRENLTAFSGDVTAITRPFFLFQSESLLALFLSVSEKLHPPLIRLEIHIPFMI